MSAGLGRKWRLGKELGDCLGEKVCENERRAGTPQRAVPYSAPDLAGVGAEG